MKTTKKTLEAEAWVDRFIEKHKYPPTYKEIAEGLKLSETATFARCRTFREKLNMSKRTKNNFDIGTFESALKYMKGGGFCQRETTKNETVVILHKKELMFLYQPNGIRFSYVPTNEDLLANDWMQLPK
jgi:hypothetical protein